MIPDALARPLFDFRDAIPAQITAIRSTSATALGAS